MNDSACALCNTGFDGREELRVHLMVDHRKSAVIDGYVDRAASRRPPAE